MHMDLEFDECVWNSVKRAGPELAEYYAKEWRDIENAYLARHEPEKNAHFTILNMPSRNGFRFMTGPKPL
jgi:hypothetical protein